VKGGRSDLDAMDRSRQDVVPAILLDDRKLLVKDCKKEGTVLVNSDAARVLAGHLKFQVANQLMICRLRGRLHCQNERSSE
jgi:hypothetical protein